jgi:16S rRNA (uracil1498-N3)-methyltransferase
MATGFMHRFYLPPEQCRGERLRIEDREAHHALHVLRLKRGDNITVLNGAGGVLLCQVESAGKNALEVSVREQKSVPALPCPITLHVAIPRGKIIEDIIQKAVELGVQRVAPLLTERVVTHLDNDGADAKREKWQQVAIEAVKQCGAAWLPRVERPRAIGEVLAAGAETEFSLVGSLQTERRHPHNWISDFRQTHGCAPRSAGVWIGPEGDFTLAELQAIEASGAKPITLGQLTLRVETATVYCLSILNYELRR